MMSHAGDVPVVAPLRKLAADAVKRIVNENPLLFEKLHIVAPLDYLHFGYLTANALGIVTDSGNVAEEATFNTVPCITLNSYTEHIETVKVGSNVLVGEDPVQLGEEMARMVDGEWKHCGIPERWDGRSAERIVQTLMECAAK